MPHLPEGSAVVLGTESGICSIALLDFSHYLRQIRRQRTQARVLVLNELVTDHVIARLLNFTRQPAPDHLIFLP